MTEKRDYDQECKDTPERKYAYRFDFEVMHYYIIASMLPYRRAGDFLELGSYKGEFTEKLLQHFSDVTCVEASSEAVQAAQARLGTRATLHHALFEDVKLTQKFDNIAMVHVLEHLDNPVAILKRINTEWLSATGRFFLVCPNANAPSRQIAVKMGLISHNSAVTPAEAAHGHRVTYSLDTLEQAAKAAGLKVIHRTGVFFKALANFQWDMLLNTSIISQAYLDGCFQLGHHYPDLCASIMLVCEQGGLNDKCP